ncbi:MAG: 7-carboxy-7-deazaguanine synthase QueE [Bacteroidales bacterium]
MILRDHDFPISEIFESIQGEGNHAGVNSLFIRFQLCNITCIWCDTKYSWTRFSDKFEITDKDSLREKISRSEKKHIIFTGGEPALFRLDMLAKITGKSFHVESNGTIIPTQPLHTILHDGVEIYRDGMKEEIISEFNWVISPKLSNSKQETNDEAIKFWAKKEYAVFKFITGNVADIEEAENYALNFNIEKNRVYMGLLGTTLESQLNISLADEIVKRGFNFSPRLHVLFWGQKRGK